MLKIGIDEAGRGPWAGPVVACAFCFNPKNLPDKKFIEKINDSKKLSSKKREEIYNELVHLSKNKNPFVYFGVGVVDNYMIDEINVKKANKEAMRRAIIELSRKINFLGNKKSKNLNFTILIDGNDNYEFEELEKTPVFIVGGDTKIPEIGAGSIIAKVFRDKLMITYSSLYPNLGFENNKGYGTKKHLQTLRNKENITGVHRLSYKPIKKIVEKKEKLLLHICCGPDATIPIIDLKKDYEVICFWYDPNIQPKTEYDKRFEAFKKVCEIEKVEWIKGEYDVVNFLKKIKGLEHTPEKGEKCTKCYDMRLERTSVEAEKLSIKYRTSTLNTSPHKDLKKIFELGDKHSKNLSKNISNRKENKTNLEKETIGNEKLEFLKIAFRKNKGFERSVEYTKKYGIYRQNYCGCIYSDTFPKK